MWYRALKKSIFLILLFQTISAIGLAARFIVPLDKDVLIQMNSIPYDRELDPNEINVLVWNIYKGENDSWKSDYLNLVKDKNILLLQEANLDNNMTKTFRGSKSFEYLFATSWFDAWNDDIPTGVATASTASAISIEWQRSYYREPWIETPKMTIFTKYKLKGMSSELLVGNIHGINFVRAYKLKAMMEEAAKVISDHTGPIIFAGDFNTWTETKLADMNFIFITLGMRQVKFKNDIRTTVFGNIIDHSWVRGLIIREARVHDVDGSDHKPMTFCAEIIK